MCKSARDRFGTERVGSGVLFNPNKGHTLPHIRGQGIGYTSGYMGVDAAREPGSTLSRPAARLCAPRASLPAGVTGYPAWVLAELGWGKGGVSGGTWCDPHTPGLGEEAAMQGGSGVHNDGYGTRYELR